jgi:hypothetical protein
LKLKLIGAKLSSALFLRQFGNCFGLFYIVGKYQIQDKNPFNAALQIL